MAGNKGWNLGHNERYRGIVQEDLFDGQIPEDIVDRVH